MEAELRAIEELLKAEIGLDPTSVGPQLIQRAVRQRMRDLKHNDPAAYVREVSQSATELEELIEEVIVAESWFFRDESPFEWLRDHIRENWIAAPNRAPLRILSLPCAAGEEPYSIAIVLSEEGLPARRYQIDGIDISSRRLAKARRGVYSQNAFRGPDAPHRERYFRQHPEGYEIAPELRTKVRFIQASILDPQLLEGSPPFDVIFCRNLLIYLTPSARATLLGHINELLAPDGALVTGHADRLDSTEAGRSFAPTGKTGCFAYRRIEARDPRVIPALHPLHSPVPTLSLLAPPAIRALETSRLSEITAAACQTAGLFDPEKLVPSKPEPCLRLSQASELANQGRFNEAIGLCERFLREKGLDAPAYGLMGMICQAAGDRGRAEDCFRRLSILTPIRTRHSSLWHCSLSTVVTRRPPPGFAAARNESKPCHGSG